MGPLKIMSNEMSITSICLKCKHYNQNEGQCQATNPFAKKGDSHFLLLREKSACYGFETETTSS
jgi:hypothetical protein